MPDPSTETAPGEKRRRVEFFARERAGDRSVLWRVGAWAGVAVASVTIAAVVANSPTGARHGALTMANSLIADQHKQIQQLAAINDREARRLSNAVDTLNADRNRLFKRVTDLEHNLDTVTGSVTRITAAQPPAPATVAAPPANIAAPATLPAAEPAKPEASKAEPAKPAEAAKGVSPQAAKPETAGSVATLPKAEPKAEPKPEQKIAAATADLPKIEIVRVEPKSEPAKSEPAKTEPAKVEAAKPETPPLNAAKLDILRPETAKPEPAKAEKPASAAPQMSAPKAEPTKSDKTDDEPTGTVNQTQFGVDLGHASSVEGLRAIWSATRKTHGTLVDGLQPVIAIREQNNGMGMQLRLVAGPMTDAAAAAKLCARIGDDERPCRTAVYDGQRLAMRGDTAMEPEAAPAPSPQRASRPAKSSSRPERTERKPKADPKAQTRFNFPFFSQQ